jgi:hypothetical protein
MNSLKGLSNFDIPVIRGMLRRGDHQHDIAARFGVNQGRISEINKGHRWGEVPGITTFDSLPPSGPIHPNS